MATWNVALHNLDGTVRLATVPVKEWSFTHVLNGPGSFEARLNISGTGVTETNFTPGKREIHVTRNGNDVWGGYLWAVAVDNPVPGAEVTIRAEGYFSRLRRRLVMSDLHYEDTNQQTIAWNLIAHTQALANGDLAITQGTHTGGNVLRDRDYCAMDRPNIGEAIEELAFGDDGFDFCITPTPGITTSKAFRTWQPKKTSAGSVATLDQTNATELTYEIDASDSVNKVTVRGAGDCNPHFEDYSDATAAAGYGLLQSFVTIDSTDLRDVKAKGNEVLRQAKNGRWQAQAVFAEAQGPTWGTYALGETVTIGSSRGFATFSKTMRVVEIETLFEPGFDPFFRVALDEKAG